MGYGGAAMARLTAFFRENGTGMLFTAIYIAAFGIAGAIETGVVWP